MPSTLGFTPVRPAYPGLRITLAPPSFVGNEHGKHFPDTNGRRDVAGKAKLHYACTFFRSRRVHRALVQRSVEPQIALVVDEVSV